jgi:hypothetical protein
VYRISHAIFSPLAFSPTFPMMLVQVAPKLIFSKSKMVSIKKKKFSALTLKHLLSIIVICDHLKVSLDNTFKPKIQSHISLLISRYIISPRQGSPLPIGQTLLAKPVFSVILLFNNDSTLVLF